MRKKTDFIEVGVKIQFSSELTAIRRVHFYWRGWFAIVTALLIAQFPAAAMENSNVRERVMVFGDSLSAAYGITPKDGWVSLMEAKLQLQGISVVNASISGETSRGGLSRIKTDLARLSPTIVIVALGANDALRGLPNADTRKNLEAIIAASRATGARVILTGIQIPPNYGLEYAQQFRDMYPDLAAKYKLPLVPFLLEGIADKLEFFQADRLHPTAAAQPRIVENVLPAVWQAVSKTSAAARK